MEYEDLKIVKRKNKKSVVFLILTIILSIGFSLAAIYYVYVYKDSRENKISSGLISINFEEGENTITLSNTVPVLDEVGMAENTPYTFSVTNTSSVPINAKIMLELGSYDIDLSAVRYAFYIGNSLVKKDYIHEDSLVLYTINNFEPNQTLDCKIVFWIDYYYETPLKTFNAKIKAVGESFDIIVDKKYDVTLNPNGGTINSTVKRVTYGENYGTLPTPEREGYTFLGWSNLADGFQQIEYIETNGTQYIDTGVVANQNTGFYIDFLTHNIINSTYTNTIEGYATIFGSRQNYNNRGYQLTTFNDANLEGHFLFGTDLNSVSTIRYSAGITPNTRQQISFKNFVLKRPNNTTVNVLNQTFETPSTLLLFGIFSFNTSTFTELSFTRLYNFKLYNGNSILKDFIPCINVSTSKIGICDSINNEFLTSTTGDNFTYGNRVYVTDSTKVINDYNHTLYAVWEANS